MNSDWPDHRHNKKLEHTYLKFLTLTVEKNVFMGSCTFTNQEIWTYYVVSVDNNNMAAHLARSDCEGFFFKCCISNAKDGTSEDMLWNGNKEDGIVMC